jgi:hypothetical protein
MIEYRNSSNLILSYQGARLFTEFYSLCMNCRDFNWSCIMPSAVLTENMSSVGIHVVIIADEIVNRLGINDDSTYVQKEVLMMGFRCGLSILWRSIEKA